MGFPRQEYRSGLPFSSPGDLPNPWIMLLDLILPICKTGWLSQSLLCSEPLSIPCLETQCLWVLVIADLISFTCSVGLAANHFRVRVTSATSSSSQGSYACPQTQLQHSSASVSLPFPCFSSFETKLPKEVFLGRLLYSVLATNLNHKEGVCSLHTILFIGSLIWCVF